MDERRSRRKTSKAIDYSKEQEFSDDDIFEDSLKEKANQREDLLPSRKRTVRPKKFENEEVVNNYVFDEVPNSYALPQNPVYVEKGYDITLPPIRERYTFAPEYEEDGSPKIELIVGRRPIEEKSKHLSHAKNDKKEKKDVKNKDGQKNSRQNTNHESDEMRKHFEYEYLIKYKGRSYLHLEWKSSSELESMNKSAKFLYRRFVRKAESGTADESPATIADPNFDSSFALPQKIVDEKDQEILVDYTDKELIQWEKQQEKERAETDDGSESNDEKKSTKNKNHPNEDEAKEKPLGNSENALNTVGKEIDQGVVEDGSSSPIHSEDTLEVKINKIRFLLKKDGPYYPSFPDSGNHYSDGYVTGPPKKSRASYLFFQCAHRADYQKRYAGASTGEIMTILGDTWRTMSEEEQAPYLALAKEEAEKFEKERQLYERAQRPSEIWQPIRRCLKVLERLWADGFSSIFQEPVDLDMFPDYTEIIDTPMDLSTIRDKLKKKKYQAPEVFARDIRRVWQNCKVYNQHGSAIWHVADYMSKQFERLYHAWVLAFRDRQLRWCNPKARPWESSCRKTDGACGTPDEDMVLCDYCDAMYGVKCIGLKGIPEGVWHCEDCESLVQSGKVRLYSSLAEQAARKRAELGDIPKKTIKQRVFLVKWAGLGYEHCTWETAQDINDDGLINEYRLLNSKVPDEPDVTEEDLIDVLSNMQWPGASSTSMQLGLMNDLRNTLYAQTRAFQFLKYGQSLPVNLGACCGTFSKSEIVHSETYPFEVASCLFDLISRISLSGGRPTNAKSVSTPILMGEYEAIVPVTSKGLLMNVGELNNHHTAFLGYRQFPDGSKGPAELNQILRAVGDRIIAVDGQSTADKGFSDVIELLRDSGQNKFTYMRFWSVRYSHCTSELTSTGEVGNFLYYDLMNQFKTDRRYLLQKRRLQNLTGNVILQEKNVDGAVEDEVEEESEDEEDEELESDYDADELVMEQKVKMEVEKYKSTLSNPLYPNASAVPVGSSVDNKVVLDHSSPNSSSVVKDENQNGIAGVDDSSFKHTKETGAPPLAVSSNVKIQSAVLKAEEDVIQKEIKQIRAPQESTKSMAMRLLDFDVDYSSDEGGGEEHAFFLDGVDASFSTKCDAFNCTEVELKSATVPMKKNEFSILGNRAKLVVASMLSTCSDPDASEYKNYPNPSERALALAEEEKEKEKTDSLSETAKNLDPNRKSTTKVEQLSPSSSDVIHVWANAEEAAATLQIPLNEIKAVLRGDYNEEVGDEVGGYRWRHAPVHAKVTAGESAKGVSGRDSKKARQAYLEFREKLYSYEEPHVYKGGHKLRDYQVDGVNWLASCWYKRHSCILADEMGLGKTVQIVCYIEHLFRVEKLFRPFLVVVPLSTVEHWRREFEGWTDMMCCVYHDRQREWRDVMREYEWYYQDRPHNADYLKFDVLVTTYDTLIGDFDVISQIPWRVTVVDEAHRLRNVKGKLLDCMKQISAKGTLHYGFQSRVLMTGTPLQNNTQELWTLLNFIEPFQFPSLEEFENSFGNMAKREQVEALQRKISPFMLRRVKEDVAKDIPSKEETLIDVELTSIQKQYYRAVFEHNHAFLSMGATRATVPKLMNIQMELRKCCNHPFLLDGVEQREMDKCYKELFESGQLSGKSPDEQQMILNDHGYIKSSGKMVLLDKLLPKLRQEGHKILIFSQMVKMLDLISEYCDFKGFKHERLDGRVRGNERQKAIDRFETEDDSFIFLLSTRAGGVGINLTAADICIIFDSDWNPQNDVQAQARCHRIGQTKDVMIYRLITSRTFEQEMFDRASKKLGLEQAVLGTFGQDNDDDKPTHKEMEQLLKKGAYALMEDDNDEMGKQFCEDDIESILAKRTRTRVVEGAKTASWLNKQGMNVTKSKFTSEGAGATADVDVDDPLFWQKVMPDFVTPAIMLTKLKELCREKAGIENGKPGPGRPPGRPGRKKKIIPTIEPPPQVNVKVGNDVQQPPNKEGTPNSHKSGKTEKPVVRPLIKKTKEFIADLASMMERILDEEEDGNLPQSDKLTCQKLLLTVSVREKIFSDDQRNVAKLLLRRLEGDRKRRCRTSEGFMDTTRMSSKVRDKEGDGNDTGKRRKKRGRKPLNHNNDDDEFSPKPRSKGGFLGDDGFLHHSDSEADWSDVGDENNLKRKISKKEARRRRAWACDKDAAAAAGRPWPVFPRNYVNQVLNAMLEEVIKNDKAKGGLFSIPVPRDVFPEYYDVVKNPMDYGTMKEKLARGEYRSVQAMQKDFVLVMQNCLQFNAPDSDIVKEARRQALCMPGMLRTSALKNKLFLSEDGTVFEIHSGDEKDSEEGEKPIKGKKRGRKPKADKLKKKAEIQSLNDAKEIEELHTKPIVPGFESDSDADDESSYNSSDGNSDESASFSSSSARKPRIRISLNGAKGESHPKESTTSAKGKKRGRKKKVQDPNQMAATIPKKRKKDEKSEQFTKKNKKAKVKKDEQEKLASIPENVADTVPKLPKIPKKAFGTNDTGSVDAGMGYDSEESGYISEGGKRDTDDAPLSSVLIGSDVYLDIEKLKEEREKFDSHDFDSARNHFTKRGPWGLPSSVAQEKCNDVARHTLNKMCRHDNYGLFADKVTDDEAPGYSSIVQNPMDFATMRYKLDNGKYGVGAEVLMSFYRDFLLIMDNCGLYNDKTSDVGIEAARLMSLLPEVFSAACLAVSDKSFKKLKKKKP